MVDIDNDGEINKVSEQQKEEGIAVNHNKDKLGTEFFLSENIKNLGILRVAREHNTTVIEIKNGNTNDDPFVIRRVIDFKNWNTFIKEIKTNLFGDLQFELDRKHLNRIVSNVETVLNKNYEAIKNPIGSHDVQAHVNQHKNEVGNVTNNLSLTDKKTREENVPIPLLTIHDLVKKQSGTFNTQGTIVSITPIMQAISKIKWKCSNDMTDANGSPVCANPYNERTFDPPLLRLDGLKLRCASCSDYAPDVAGPIVYKEWLNYIIIQVQDDDSPFIDHLQKMTTFVYDEYVSSMRVGERVKIHGNIRVPLKPYDKPYSGKMLSSNLSSVLYAESVSYERKEKIKITEKDIAAFEKFVKYPNLMDRLASMFAPNVVGHKDKKIAILLAAVGAPETKEKNKRGRIHVLLVGPPGTAKTTLSYEALNLLPNSRFTAAQTSSAKTIIAIVEVLGDVKVIRYGAVPLAKDAICVIDEIGAMSFDDQVSLFSVMEHGEIPLNKQGESRNIPAPTTIIGTSNPKNIDANWRTSGKASKDEIPLRRALVDRFDISLIFEDEDTEESAKNYALEKIRISKMHFHNYNYLGKLLTQIRSTITKVTFTREAESMIARYYAAVKVNKDLAMTPRSFETLIRICKALARLYMKYEVDADIVNEVQSYYSTIMLQYGQVIKAAIDPREVASEQIIQIIKQTTCPILFEEAAMQACQCNQVVKDYIGSNLKLRHNNRLHEISERIREYINIRVVGLRPLVLGWTKESSESSSNENNNQVGEQKKYDDFKEGN